MKTMWKFIEPTRPKVWIAIIMWTYYWLVGKVDTSISFPVIGLLYPEYFSHIMETMLPQSEKLMALMGPNIAEVTNLSLAIHIAVGAVLGYVGACLIIFLFKNDKTI
jgi:hypothetical protein